MYYMYLYVLWSPLIEGHGHDFGHDLFKDQVGHSNCQQKFQFVIEL